MGEEDTRLYYNKISYALAENRIEELLSELSELSLRGKLDKISKNKGSQFIQIDFSANRCNG